MKIASHILSLFLSDLKSEDIYVQLLFITLVLKAKWVLLMVLLNHAVKTFNCTHAWAGNRVSHRLALCYKV
jgi:hypothetical protein